MSVMTSVVVPLGPWGPYLAFARLVLFHTLHHTLHHTLRHTVHHTRVCVDHGNSFAIPILPATPSSKTDEGTTTRQNGHIITCDGAPVHYGSKVSSITFTHPNINESHVDISSGANEIYAAGNATQECLHLSYVVDEMGMDFPQPIPLQMDNTTVEAFANNNAKKTKLKHIDARQEWVKVLRDKSILVPVHDIVPTKRNLADIFTKILTVPEFTRLWNMIMVQPHL